MDRRAEGQEGGTATPPLNYMGKDPHEERKRLGQNDPHPANRERQPNKRSIAITAWRRRNAAIRRYETEYLGGHQ